MMTNPLAIDSHARRVLIEELMCLTGADALNVIQHRRELEAMTLPELVKMRDAVLDDLDKRFSPR